MHKFCLAITTVITFLFTSAVYADADNSGTNIAHAAEAGNSGTNNLKDYYSTKHPKQKAKLDTAAQAVPPVKWSISPTNITLVNATSDVMFAVVPGTQVYDQLFPRSNLHIYNDYFYADTRLVLKDPYSATFYNDYVCRRAIVTVFGQPGAYSLLIDREFCDY